MKLRLLPPQKVAQTLAVVGTIGLAYFFFIAKFEFGSALAVCIVLGSATVQYADRKPFVVPLFAGMVALVVLLQLARGELVAAILGAGIGIGLPYLVHRVQLRAQRESS